MDTWISLGKQAELAGSTANLPGTQLGKQAAIAASAANLPDPQLGKLAELAMEFNIAANKAMIP